MSAPNANFSGSSAKQQRYHAFLSHNGKDKLPVILPGEQRAKESDVPGFLQGTTWVKFEKSIEEEDALYRLECGIRGIPPGRRPGVTISEGECPYLGLKTFQPEDATLFFGREAKIQELIERLRNGFGTSKEERFLALIGASGSGKSSLALAGLIPAIRHGELPDSATWPLVRCRPGARPWESLHIALGANQKIAPHLATLPAFILRPEDGQRRLHLTAGLALHDAPEAHRLFVLIDQFEEIFTLCNEESDRSQLIENVLYATSVAEARTIVVLTMRADFYGQCASYPGLRAAISDHQSLIGPLSEDELREAIETPAQVAGGEIEPGLMDLLLSDMKGQAGALPFLEHALFKLWESRDRRRLTTKAYIDMKRLGGALDAHAEEFFTKTLTLEEQDLCRQILLDLVHPGEGAADTKKRVAVDDVASTAAARVALKKLTDARLVTMSGQLEAQAELAHEALISGWRRLGNWVNENREESRLKERLLESAHEWQKNRKAEDFLYRGTQLAAAEEGFGSSAQSLPKLGREFLEASIAKRNRDQEETQRQQEEKERQLREASRQLGNVDWLFGVQARDNQKDVLRAGHFFFRGAEEFQFAGEEALAKSATLAGVLASRSVVGGFPHESIRGAVFNSEKSRILTWSDDGAARLWAVAEREPLQTFKHGGRVLGAVFNSEGSRILTWGGDMTARLWAVGQDEPLQTFKHGGGVSGAVFNREESRILTWSGDGTARLWAVGQNEPLQTFKHEESVSGAVFNSEESRILTWSQDGTARLWIISLEENISPDERILDFQVRSAASLHNLAELRGTHL